MILRIDPGAAEPPFAQLCSQITEQVVAGRLRPGDRLPTVRRLAGDLGIAPNTVARAYRELEADGILRGQGRAGTFVAGVVEGEAWPEGGGAEPGAAAAAAGAAAGAAARDYARVVQDLGLAPAEALALVRKALQG